MHNNLEILHTNVGILFVYLSIRNCHSHHTFHSHLRCSVLMGIDSHNTILRLNINKLDLPSLRQAKFSPAYFKRVSLN